MNLTLCCSICCSSSLVSRFAFLQHSTVPSYEHPPLYLWKPPSYSQLFFPPGCLPLLIQLLHGSDKEPGLLGNTRGSKAARARAAAALHNIVHSHPDDKRGRREARVLRLLEQLRAHCDQLREAIGKCGDDSAGGDTEKTTPGGGATAVVNNLAKRNFAIIL